MIPEFLRSPLVSDSIRMSLILFFKIKNFIKISYKNYNQSIFIFDKELK